jgi:hypothetical protein
MKHKHMKTQYDYRNDMFYSYVHRVHMVPQYDVQRAEVLRGHHVFPSTLLLLYSKIHYFLKGTHVQELVVRFSQFLAAFNYSQGLGPEF